MQHYTINIDIDDLMSGRIDRKLKGIDKAIDRGIKKGIRKCDERIKDKLRERMDAYGLGSSLLSGTVYSKITPTTLSIRMGSEYFMYVEYGTGVVGKDNSHPYPGKVGWEYDTKEHGEEGWWYPSGADDLNPTKYRGETGWWAWTKGQAARPFMYDTWMWAMRNSGGIISEEIGKELKKLERKS